MHVLLVNIVTVTRFLTNISIELNVVSDVFQGHPEDENSGNSVKMICDSF